MRPLAAEPVRLFSTDKNKDDKDKDSPLTTYKPQLMQAAVVGGVALTLYGLSSFMWDITYGLMSMTPIQSGYYGFVTGIATSGTGLGLVYYGKQHQSVDVNSAIRNSISVLNSNEDIRSVMGGSVKCGELASFRHSYGYWTVSGFRPKWIPAKADLLFNIYSERTEGVVSVEAVQRGVQANLEFVGVDVFNDHSSRILVKGNASGFENHDALCALVSFKSRVE